MPTDLDLAGSIRERLEDDRPHRNVARPIDHSPTAEPWVCRELAQGPLDAFECLLTLQPWSSRKPAHDLGMSVDLDEAINFIQPPRADYEPVRRDYSRTIVAFNHTAILPQALCSHSL